jgi:hypothetical protein
MAPIRRREAQERREREQAEAKVRDEVLAAERRSRPTLPALRASAGLMSPTGQAIDEAGTRIASQLAHAERARRVEMELAERRARREASAA